MKIAIDCHVLSLENWAGKEHFLNSVLRQIINLDHDNDYILYFREPVFRQETLPKNFVVKNIKIRAPFWQMLLLWDLFVNKVEVLFCPCAYLLPALNFFCPAVIIIYDLTTFIPQIRMTHILALRIREGLLLKLGIRNSKKIIAISKNTKNDLIKYFQINPDKISVIYGAAQPIFKQIDESADVKERWSKYNIAGKYIFTVGTLEPRKNHIRLIEAYHRLAKNIRDNYQLVIAGKKGWLYDGIFAKVKELKLNNNINFIDYVIDGDLPLLYNFATCFVYPSLYEGFGLPIVEAMACGCPVITSNISSMPEAAGEAAVLINPYDVNDMAEAMRRVLSDENLRQTMKKKGLAQAAKFSWHDSAAGIINLFKESAR